MSEVGSFEAKNRLSELLVRAEQGEEIIITKHGRPVAKLVAVDNASAREERSRAAAERLLSRARKRKAKFDWAEWKSYRDQGRP
jgi:prevent-host-death family protein